jgi:hypothetical protein
MGAVLGLLHTVAGGSTSKGTKVSNLYKYFKYIFLIIPGIVGSPYVEPISKFVLKNVGK